MDDTPDEDAAPPLPDHPVTRTGDLWLCGSHRVLCGDATDPEVVSRLLGERKPLLMVTDPPYGIELDSEWRDRAGLNGRGPAEPSYMKQRTKGHQETTHLRRHARRLVGGICAGSESGSRLCLARIEVHPRGSRWPAADRLPAPSADHLEQGAHGAHQNALLVPA